MIEKGAKIAKKHEKYLGPINVLPQGCAYEVSDHTSNTIPT
jgi:hypothetical protein